MLERLAREPDRAARSGAAAERGSDAMTSAGATIQRIQVSRSEAKQKVLEAVDAGDSGEWDNVDLERFMDGLPKPNNGNGGTSD